MNFAKLAVGLICGMLVACDQAPKTADIDQQYLQQQAQQQGYPLLIATPVTADYALPFCEKAYCIDVEIFGFKSQDQWFNAYNDQQIADLIRQQLSLSQKLSLQRAVNEFVQRSDAWLAEDNNNKPWMMYIKPRVALQQSELVLLVINSEYQLGDDAIPEQHYFYVANRKTQNTVRLYDVIKAEQRIALSQKIQQHYQDWQLKLNEQQQASDEQKTSDEQKQPLADKLYWANQDWFFDEQGIAVYYRARDLGIQDAEDLTIYLSPEEMQQWIKPEYLALLKLTI